MKPKARYVLAGTVYLLALLWEIYKDQLGGAFQLYAFLLRSSARMLLYHPFVLLPAAGIAALAALAAMAWRGRVSHLMKILCTAIVALRFLAPFAHVRIMPSAAPDLLLIPAVLCVAAVVFASFALLQKDKLFEKIEDKNGGGYYADLYRQGVISLEEYEEMTRDR